MSNHINLDEKVEKKFSRRDKKKNRKMKVDGKDVIKLKKIINQKDKN